MKTKTLIILILSCIMINNDLSLNEKGNEFFFINGNENNEKGTGETEKKSSQQKYDDLSLNQLRHLIEIAEQRAQNAENELNTLKKKFDDSNKICIETSVKQSNDLNKCNEHNRELGKRFNIAQQELFQLKSSPKKNNNTENDEKNDLLKSITAETNKLIEEKNKLIKENDDKKTEIMKLKKEKDLYATKMENIVSDLNKRLINASTSHEENKRKISNDYYQKEMNSTLLFSKDILIESLSKTYMFSKQFCIYILSFMPEKMYNNMIILSNFDVKKSKDITIIKRFMQYYDDKLKIYLDRHLKMSMNYYHRLKSLYIKHLHDIVLKYYIMSNNLFMKMIEYITLKSSEFNDNVISNKLNEIFSSDPNLMSHIPDSLFDRILCILYVTVVSYISVRICYCMLRCFLLPILRCVLSLALVFLCCGKRCKSKTMSTSNGIKNQRPLNKRTFTPAMNNGNNNNFVQQCTSKKYKDVNQSSSSSLSKKVMA